MPSTGGPGGPAASQGTGFSVSDAFNYGWQKFQQNMGPIILGTLAYLGIAILLGLIWFFVTSAIGFVGGDSNAGVIAALFSMAIMGVALVALSFVIQAGIIRAALAITYGEPIELKTLLATDGLGQIILTAVIVGVASGIGLFLCVIPGLLVMLFSSFAMHFVIDKRLPAIEAIKASVELVNRNLGTMIVLLIAGYVANMVGSLLCGIGVLVSFPVVLIANTYAYRRMQGEAVAA